MDLPYNLINFIRDDFFIILSWFFLAISFFSWGNLLSKLLNLDLKGLYHITTRIWLGFVFCVFFFSLYHLFFSINFLISCLFYVPSVVYFFIKYYKKFPKFIKFVGYYKIVVILLTLFVSSGVSLQRQYNADTSLYHSATIRWANEYPIIKGLGCLHDRLAFNQLSFLYTASLSFHPYLNNYASHISNSFLYALFFVGLLIKGTFIDLLFICLFFYIPMPYHWINCSTPDMTSSLIQLIVFRYYIDFAYFKINLEKKYSYISFIAILSALLITIKLSNVFFVIGLFIVTLILEKKSYLSIKEKNILKKSFVLISLVFFIWIVRGYIQSGYPFFPSSLGKINFVWAVPDNISKKEKNLIFTSSRTSNLVLDKDSPLFKNFTWLDLWLREHLLKQINQWYYFSEDDNLTNFFALLTLIIFPFSHNNWFIGSVNLFFLSIIISFVRLVIVLKRKNSIKDDNIYWLLICMEIIVILAWFITAPAPRFSNSIFLILFITTLLPFVKTINKFTVNNLWYLRILALYTFIIFLWNMSMAYMSNEFQIDGISKPKYKLREQTNKNGVRIFTPKGTVDYEIGDSNLMASIYVLDSLALIGDSIDEGFCIKQPNTNVIIYRGVYYYLNEQGKMIKIP